MEGCHTGSIVTQPKVSGRDKDKEKIIDYLVKHVACRDKISVYPVSGLGGLAKISVTKLQNLFISQCYKLKKRCEKERGQDWPKIAHVQNVYLESLLAELQTSSCGHTAEMMNLLSVLQMDRFTPRFYIAAATDNMSLQKARVFEDSLLHKKVIKGSSAQFMQIYRSREVGQSYVTSVWTTLLATTHALWLMVKIRPQVVLCNGPGTCIPLCVIAFLFKVIGIRWSSIFYVESIARVKRLSLSGLLLYKLCIADQFFVQWPQLQRKYPRAHYVGCLM
ncbi:glycosyltransferase [Citrus sinensis]|nr:glycosyltransferase [Citrus sinensis]